MLNINKIINNGFACAKLRKICINSNNTSNEVFDEIKEEERFISAIKKATSSLEENELNGFESLLEAHKLIINDPIMIKEVIDMIKEQKVKANVACDTIMDKYIEMFKNAATTYLQERALDLIDIKKNLLLLLNNSVKQKIEGDFICYADEMYPSILMTYKNQIKGVICKSGGVTSHSAIICRSKEIPYIIISDDSKLVDGKEIIINTTINKVIISPSNDEINSFKEMIKCSDDTNYDFKLIDDEISVMLNASSNDELDKVLKYELDGVGLYRTEFIFMNTYKPLSTQEQTIFYKEASSLVNNKPINFRTFDIGDDKVIPYIKSNKKGIDNYINNKEIFESQIQSLLQANVNNNIGIMFPMIESYDEFMYLKSWVLKIKEDINNESIVKIGMMLETKRAYESLSDFKDIDFISLGTNDLTKELYNIDRDKLSDYNEYVNDLLLKISKIVVHCNKYNISLSICGEIAGTKGITQKLYEVGLKKFSVSAACVKNLKTTFKQN